MSSTTISFENRTNKWHQDDYSQTFSGRGNYPIANQVVYHSAIHYMGDLHGKTVLDVACGEGNFCRLVKSKGATRVLGVDISSALLDYAQKQGKDCEYRHGNGFDLGFIDQFDFVTALRFLTYSETVADLKAACRGFYNNLKPNGHFIALGHNCFEEPTWDDKIARFGFERFTSLPPLGEAKRIEHFGVDLSTGKSNFRAVCFYYEPHVYEEAFMEAGFRKFSFQPALIDKSVLQPEGFWDIFEEKPHLLCYIAVK